MKYDIYSHNSTLL